MKKRIFLALVLTAAMLLASCGGKISVSIDTGESEIYTEREIRRAMDVVISHFRWHYNGCELTRLWYDEESTLKEAKGWAEQYDSDEVIVLLSDFRVDASGGDGSLNPNSTYTKWSWVLVRSWSGWKLKTWGYA